MQITLRFYVDEGAFSDALTDSLSTAVSEDEGITLVTAGGKYFIDLDSVDVNP